MKASLRHAAGSLLVVGLSGTELTGLERAWLRVVRPGGVILFRRNIVDAAQTRLLLAESTGLCADHAFRCVDVEGGSVDRLRDALAPMPSAQAVAQAARNYGSWTLAHEHGELIALAVKAFGFNVTLAPVLDLGLPESAAVMGSRTAGSTAGEVIDFAREFFTGLAAHRIVGAGKHFPGLGGGTLDSHSETPRIRRTWTQMWTQDLEPYRALRKEMPMVMVNHASYLVTKGKKVPATVSSFWINVVLRKRLNYGGIIFSDDLEMGGILKFLTIEKAAVAAIRAGMDTLEVCHSPELILRAYEALVHEAEISKPFATLLRMRALDVASKRRHLFAGPVSKPLDTEELEALRTRILRFRDRIVELAGDAGRSGSKAETRPVVETA